MSNYRPISVISQLAKLLEKCYYVRLTKFIKSKDILSNSQYGFRDGHSTAHAMLDLLSRVDELLSVKNCIPVGVFIDLKKAFDTVNHNILLQKLEVYGIRGLSLAWLQNYLTNRKHQTKILPPQLQT